MALSELILNILKDLSFASLSYALIDLVALELFISLLFTFDRRGGIKWRANKGFREYTDTWKYTAVVISSGVIYFYLSNYFQASVIDYFKALKMNAFPLFVTLVGFTSFWVSKVAASRSWRNKAVIGSIVIFFIGIFIWY